MDGAGRIPEALGRSEVFSGLPAEDAGRLAAAFRRRRYPAGTLVFSRGDAGDFALLVEDGRLRLSVMAGDGRELSLRIAGPGSLIGEIALLDGGLRTADATAMSDVEAAVLSRGDFLRLVGDRPDIARAVIAALCAKLRDTTDQLESIALHRLEGRLARFFLSLARQAGAEEGDRATLRVDLNQSDIADIVGGSRPKVNRALAALEEAGAIRRKGPEVLCRLDRLASIAEGEA